MGYRAISFFTTLSETLILLDFGKTPTLTDALFMIKSAADIADQSNRNSVFLRYPIKTKTQKMSAHLSVCRKIDDKLLECGLQIDNKITLNFNMSSCHGNDARAGSHECRLCTSAIAGQGSDWYLCRALLNHGRIDNVDLVTPKHMKAVPKKQTKLVLRQLMLRMVLSPCHSRRGWLQLAQLVLKLSFMILSWVAAHLTATKPAKLSYLI